FVTSGIQFNLGALFEDAGTILRVPMFLAALLLVRGLPALLYRAAGLSWPEVTASALLQATSLPVIVAAATIGLKLDAIRPENASALIAAGLLSVLLFPLIALPLLHRSRQHPAADGRTRVRQLKIEPDDRGRRAPDSRAVPPMAQPQAGGTGAADERLPAPAPRRRR
ncbi:cation:proton antiporter domain-containing protein, partial [Streptomyces sp. NPDC002309]